MAFLAPLLPCRPLSRVAPGRDRALGSPTWPEVRNGNMAAPWVCTGSTELRAPLTHATLGFSRVFPSRFSGPSSLLILGFLDSQISHLPPFTLWLWPFWVPHSLWEVREIWYSMFYLLWFPVAPHGMNEALLPERTPPLAGEWADNSSLFLCL